MGSILVWILASALLLLAVGVLFLARVYFKLARIDKTRSWQDNIKAEADRLHRKARIPDVMIGVIQSDGQMWFHGAGTHAPGPDTPFQIGSITKVLTATLFQRLVEKQHLHMDDTLDKLLGDQMQLDTSVKAITLHQLSTHRAGFSSIPQPLEETIIHNVGKDAFMQDPFNSITIEAIWNYLQTPTGLEAPGSFEYSNYGMGLLAHIMERVTGVSYPDLLRREILTPLGMTSTDADLTEAIADTLIAGHDAKGNPCLPWRFQVLAGAGSVISTARDMLRFAQAHMDLTSPLAASLEQTRRPQTDNMALGWFRPTRLDRMLRNRDILWHNGMVNGYAAYLGLDAPRNQAVIILANKGTDVTLSGMHITKILREQA